jgi:acyl-CoA dehydrogenase family protein 9
VEKVLRKHGKNIVEMQYTLRRVCDITIDLYAAIATLSRTTYMIESKGEEKAAREIKLCQAFCEAAMRRMNRNVRQFDKNDDERLKEVADDIYGTEGYPYDIAQAH